MTSPKPVTGLSSSDAAHILTEVGANELASQPAALRVAFSLRLNCDEGFRAAVWIISSSLPPYNGPNHQVAWPLNRRARR